MFSFYAGPCQLRSPGCMELVMCEFPSCPGHLSPGASALLRPFALSSAQLSSQAFLLPTAWEFPLPVSCIEYLFFLVFFSHIGGVHHQSLSEINRMRGTIFESLHLWNYIYPPSHRLIDRLDVEFYANGIFPSVF